MNAYNWFHKALQKVLLLTLCLYGASVDGTVNTYAEVLDLRPDIKYATRFAHNVYGVAGNNIVVSIDKDDFEATVTNSVNHFSMGVRLTTTTMDFVQTKTIFGIAALDDSPGKRCIAVLVENEGAREIYLAPTVRTTSSPQALIFDTTPYVPSLSYHTASSFTTSSDQIVGIHSLPVQHLVASNYSRLFLSTREGKVFELDVTSVGTTFRLVACVPYARTSWKIHGNYGKRNVNNLLD